jgi:hypothetical protein
LRVASVVDADADVLVLSGLVVTSARAAFWSCSIFEALLVKDLFAIILGKA